VLDGDTIEIDGGRVRLHGIDTAEDGQRCGLADGGAWDAQKLQPRACGPSRPAAR
jgi:endonuclease YncB( thermonuclease family)